MRIYIAYKFRYITDKEALKNELQQISDYFVSKGHDAFILGRDVQKWQNHEYSKIATTMDILKNIWKYNMLFVYLSSDVHTNGIPVEFGLAKLFGLKIYVARRSDLKPSVYEKLANKTVTFDNINDLKAKIEADF